MLQRYVHFVQCIHKTHSQHVKKMQRNIRIVLTLSRGYLEHRDRSLKLCADNSGARIFLRFVDINKDRVAKIRKPNYIENHTFSMIKL